MKPKSIFLKLGLTAILTPFMSILNFQNTTASTLFATDYADPAQPTTLYRVNPATGATTLVGESGFNQCGGMAFNSACS